MIQQRAQSCWERRAPGACAGFSARCRLQHQHRSSSCPQHLSLPCTVSTHREWRDKRVCNSCIWPTFFNESTPEKPEGKLHTWKHPAFRPDLQRCFGDQTSSVVLFLFFWRRSVARIFACRIRVFLRTRFAQHFQINTDHLVFAGLMQWKEPIQFIFWKKNIYIYIMSVMWKLTHRL